VLPEISAEQIRWLYGLTPAEAAVALAVLRGEGVRAIADGLGISVATARTHLHRIFEKTGTERQAELVRLILNSRVLLKRAEPAAAVAPDAARTVTSPARDSARRIIARPSGARLANGEWPARLR
jgi:DNA-binding CsgD family transcriptional regulator